MSQNNNNSNGHGNRKFRGGVGGGASKVLNKILNGTNTTTNSSSILISNHGSTSSLVPSHASHSSFTLDRVDKKLFDRIYKLIDKLLRYCQADRMHLTNSPPYIIDILPDTLTYINNIYTAYENKLHILNEIHYFVIFVNNCVCKYESLVQLFKQAGKKMFEETSDERKALTKYSLIFSHSFAELKSLFPNYIYEGQNFRIAKSDANEFWKSNFNDKVIVPWKEFEIKLNQVHKIHSELESNELRTTIQLTSTRYVSIFEFDVFTRLFQPWSSLLTNWKYLAFIHPGYGAFMTYDEVYKRLQQHMDKPGSYLFRLSCTKLGQWAIGYVTHDRKILQTIPQSLVQALIDGEKQGLYLYPDGREVHVDIAGQLAVAAAERITFSREQCDMYIDIGSSFQLCKICSEKNKDRRIEPCGHLICSSCLESWQDKQQIASCPFCRCEIKAFEAIILEEAQSESTSNSEFDDINLNEKTKSILNTACNTTNNQIPRYKQLSPLSSSNDNDHKQQHKLNNEDLISSLNEDSNSREGSSSNLSISPSTNTRPNALNLQPPSNPPPPLPLNQQQQASIIKITIENDNLVDNLVKFGYDRKKCVCALTITNYDFDKALIILRSYVSS